MSVVADFLNEYHKYLDGDVAKDEMLGKWQNLTPDHQKLVKRAVETSSKFNLSYFLQDTLCPSNSEGQIVLSSAILADDEVIDVELPLLGRTGSNLLFEGRAAIIVAGAKTGKSMLMLHSFKHWEGKEIKIYTEEKRPTWNRRLHKLQDAGIVLDNLKIVYDQNVGFSEVLTGIYNTERNGIVILDTLRRYGNYTDENDAIQAQAGVVPLIEAAEDAGVTLIALHHSNKTSSEYGNRSAVYASAGSTAITAKFDSIIQIKKCGDKLVIDGDVRDYKASKLEAKWIDNLLTAIDPHVNPETGKEFTLPEKILNLLREEPGLTRNEIYEKLQAGSQESIRVEVSNLKGKGKLIETGSRATATYSLPEEN